MSSPLMTSLPFYITKCYNIYNFVTRRFPMKRKLIEEAITDALLELMKTMDYDKISITDITEKAGVSRITYYRHFSSKEDILIRYFEIAKQKFQQQYSEQLKQVNYTQVITSLFSFFKENIDINKTLRSARLDHIVLDYLSEDFVRNMPQIHDKYFAHLLSGGLFNVCIRWLDNDCKDSVEEVSRPFILLNDIFSKKEATK